MGLLEDAKKRADDLGLAPSEPRAKVQKIKPVTAHAGAPLVFDDDLIPDGSSGTPEGDGLDIVIDQLDIIDTYLLWCGKMSPDYGAGQRESIMISCPDPQHRDSDPSAWINLDEQVWFCGTCQKGGDKYDIAAWHFGYDVPSYKTSSFPELRRKMAEALGYSVRKSVGGRDIVTGGPGLGEPEPEPELATVTQIAGDPVRQRSDPSRLWPQIDWRAIVSEGTFLNIWMKECAKDDLPEEYYFWLGLVALGMAIGDDATLDDSNPVKGNLFICLLGATGMGKSRSVRALEELVRDALPYDHDDPHSTGACLIANPGSAEALADSFSRPLMVDPLDPTKITGYAKVRGLLKVSELSDLVASGNRAGNKIKPMLMDLYDAPTDITLRSRGFGTVRAETPYCSMVTSTQPGAIKDLVAHTDVASGFANRFVFAGGQPKRLVAIGRSRLNLTDAAQALRRVRSWSGSGRLVNLDGAAAARFTAFFDSEIAPAKLDEDKALMARFDLVLKKVILLFSANEFVEVPPAALVDRVLAIYPYMINSTALVAEQVGSNTFNECMDAVAALISTWEGDKPPSVRDIDRFTPKRFNREMLIKVVSALLSLERIVEIPSAVGDRGRPTVRYRSVA